ncbi:MAG TPA: septal ring lytic transglycosylase RlpA family protein [Capillimicrobium sp.]
MKADVQDRSLGFGQDVVVQGRVPGAGARLPVTLEFRRAGDPGWQQVKTVTTHGGGRYRVGAELFRSGAVRVAAGGASARSTDAAVSAVSSARPVRVRARVTAGGVRRHVTAGERVKVKGALKPARSGRTVALQLRRGGAWRTVDTDRTSGEGRYRLRQRVTAAESFPARVRFRGDRRNAGAAQRIGRVTAYRFAHASWYGPGLYGNPMACGGTLSTGTVGVAHKSLPCGTRLTFRYRGNTVRARVVDRGPFVAGREFDLTYGLKVALGFGDIGTVKVAS